MSDVRVLFNFDLSTVYAKRAPSNRPLRRVTRALIGGDGCLFLYSRCLRRISYEIESILKEICRTECECMNKGPHKPDAISQRNSI